jgi:alkaline phosphatase D
LTRRGFLALVAASAASASGCTTSGIEAVDAGPDAEPDATDIHPDVSERIPDVSERIPDVPEPVPDITVPDIPADPFTLGVASGDPLSDRVILWTRLAPDPLWNGGMPDAPAPVVWEIALTEDFSTLVNEGVAVAEPEHAHSVHVDAKGLAAGTSYFYRFQVGEWTSPVGRTRTLPAADASPESLRFATASCQHYKDGFYTAHAHIQEEDLDFVVFLGDYIYESGKAGSVRDHEAGVPYSLQEYRNRYGLYRSDPALQGAHMRFPWFVIWDDHEVVNNRAGGATFATEEERTAFGDRRAAGYKAWWEHQPVRLPPPNAGELPIHRSVQFGSLASLFFLDTRQYRDELGCGGGIGAYCEDLDNPDRQLLGEDQEAWLFEGLGNSTTTWNVLAQQVVMSDLTLGGVAVNMDQWDGYPAARDRLLTLLKEQEIDNAVVLTGDIHASGVATMHETLSDVETPVVATEFVTTAVSSGSQYSESIDSVLKTFLPSIKHIHYAELTQRGYSRHTVTADAWRVDFRKVETVLEPDAPVETVASFELPRDATTSPPVNVTETDA